MRYSFLPAFARLFCLRHLCVARRKTNCARTQTRSKTATSWCLTIQLSASVASTPSLLTLPARWQCKERWSRGHAPYIASEMAATHRGKLKHTYQNALNGFAVEMSAADAEALSQDFRVKFVEEDGVMTADTTQSNPPWGLDRIDQRNRPLSATYTYNWTGSGVRAYVIDTGIRTTH